MVGMDPTIPFTIVNSVNCSGVKPRGIRLEISVKKPVFMELHSKPLCTQPSVTLTMNTDTPTVDPTDPVIEYQYEESIPDEYMDDVFDLARSAFPLHLDHTVSVKVLQDLAEMADIRFTELLDPVRRTLVEAAEKFDEEHQDAIKYTEAGASALPNWQITVGLKLNEDHLLTDEKMQDKIRQAQNPLNLLPALDTHQPVIESAAAVAVYHTFHPQDEESTMACSYLDEGFLEYDYLISIRKVDLRDCDVPPLYQLNSDDFRQLLIHLLEAKLQSMTDAELRHNTDHLFEGFTAPVLHRLRDFKDIYDPVPQQQ